MAGDALDALRAADTALRVAQLALADAVRRARREGDSWAAIGEVLGVTRQAAFKRFGAPRDPRTGGIIIPTTTADVVTLTERVFERIDAGDYGAVRELMPDDVARMLSREVVLDAWARAVADVGNLVRCTGTRVEHPHGAPVDPGEDVLGTVVGAATLECEAGTLQGRIALDADRRLVGIVVLPVDATDPPF